MDTYLLPSQQFAKAKNGLSDVMSGVVREHRPTLINRNHGREMALLLGLDEARRLLDGFAPQVTLAPGECVVRLPELGLIGGGASIDDAMTDLARDRRRVRPDLSRSLRRASSWIGE